MTARERAGTCPSSLMRVIDHMHKSSLRVKSSIPVDDVAQKRTGQEEVDGSDDDRLISTV